MRRVVTFLVVTLVVGLIGLAVADFSAPSFIRLERGSTFGVRADPSVQLPDEVDCDGPCPRRHAFQADSELSVRITVRNDSPVTVTFDGVADRWLQDFASAGLARPIGTFDPGDPGVGLSDARETEFRPVTLQPGEEWSLGVILKMADRATGCGSWDEGSAMILNTVRLAWHWLAVRHEQELRLEQPLEFVAPSDADCPTRGHSG